MAYQKLTGCSPKSLRSQVFWDDFTLRVSVKYLGKLVPIDTLIRTIQEEFVEYRLNLIDNLPEFHSHLIDYLLFLNKIRPHQALAQPAPLEDLVKQPSFVSNVRVLYTAALPLYQLSPPAAPKPTNFLFLWGMRETTCRVNSLALTLTSGLKLSRQDRFWERKLGAEIKKGEVLGSSRHWYQNFELGACFPRFRNRRSTSPKISLS